MKKLIVVMIVLLISLASVKNVLSETLMGMDIEQGTWGQTSTMYVSGQLAVKIDLNGDVEDICSDIEVLGVSIADTIDDLGWTMVSVPGNIDEITISSSISAVDGVLSVEPNFVLTAEAGLDPYYSYQWYLNGGSNGSYANIYADDAWSYLGIGSSSVDIAIFDTGIPIDASDQISHPDLEYANIVGGYNFIEDETINDYNSHGTKVCGVMAAKENNGIGIRGAVSGCDYAIYKIAGSNGKSSADLFYKAVRRAAYDGAEIINYSYGGNVASNKFTDAISYANNFDIVCVFPTGNDYGAISYPARYASSYGNVLAVGAVTYSGERASFSNYGPQISVVAPGLSIYTTTINNSVLTRYSPDSSRF